MYEKELKEELTKMWDDRDFARGVLLCLETDAQRREILNGVKDGTLYRPRLVVSRAMEMAGYATKTVE